MRPGTNSRRTLDALRRLALPLAIAVSTGLHANGADARGIAGSDSLRPHKVSSVENSPGYVPLVDAESTSVAAGRRLGAPLVRRPLRGGAHSLADLGREICRGLHAGSIDSLLALCVTEDEFRDILWREFPQSRPVTGLTWEDGWRVLSVRLRSGCISAVSDFGGHFYEFQALEADSIASYRNFKMHSRLTLVVRDDEGHVHRMNWLRAVVERKGQFKIYSTRD